jgi:hypothetical protein
MNWKTKGNLKFLCSKQIRFGVKYKDGILQDIDRPLNPKTRKVPGEQNSFGASALGGPQRRSSKASLGTSYLDQIDNYGEDPDDSFTQQVKKAKSHSGISESLNRIKG